MFRGTHMNLPAVGQHMKTIHTPKSLMSAPFLQHPALTAGQRRYLCSIASIYSTEHMRRQMKQHYVSVLHACLQSGLYVHTPETEADCCRPSQKQRRNSKRAHSDITLPKIVHR
uniref:Family with sequence similarity 216 member A n=1 Tax=Salarias fasciatus TaxID=181472 RepID=A0A672F6L5_SALFA